MEDVQNNGYASQKRMDAYPVIPYIIPPAVGILKEVRVLLFAHLCSIAFPHTHPARILGSQNLGYENIGERMVLFSPQQYQMTRRIEMYHFNAKCMLLHRCGYRITEISASHEESNSGPKNPI
ncbi:hypothetical protein NPIL_68321 [Nephila pilipes]|uniref:Uncharacterized protein n=1 Tax=Nephila pilipes TaxID=299642 RepID=A0A8X6QJX5_NEPPI|nr:hypothetical protein NPIL_68321 [Nephila pilipes]